jgi:CheY-like chemotaxis protein
MNGVIGMTDLLLRTSLTAVQQEYAEIVRKSGNNLLSLINDILDFSKIEAHKLDMESVAFDLRMAVEDTASMLAVRAREAKLGLCCEVADDVPSQLKGDGGRLRQIITNLAGNAIKFTHQGEIAIRASLASAHDGFATVRFEISDTGIGIPEDRRAAIFDPFTQADGSTTRKYGGTGLGLAICKQLVGLMGGEIGVKSEVGVGSTFWFTARFEEVGAAEQPMEPPSQKRPTAELAAQAAPALAPEPRAARILLAEDNLINQMVAAAMLEKLGYTADLVENGHDAIAALERADYDLVLMDCQMPELDGIEATTIVRDPRSKVRDHDVPIVAMTANAMKGDREACLDAGMNDYIAKPIRGEELANVLERWETATKRARPARATSPPSSRRTAS